MKKIILILTLGGFLGPNLIAQSSQNPLGNLEEGSSINQNLRNGMRIGQTFNTGGTSGEVQSIAVKLTNNSGSNGGLLAIDLYEMDSNNDMTLIGSSELTGYQVGQINLRNFAAGVQLKANTTYSFICRNNGWNTFYLATSSDTYKAGNAFICETKSNDPSAVNYNAKTELDLYFKVSLKSNPLENLEEGSSINQNLRNGMRIGQTFNTGGASGEVQSIAVKLTNNSGSNGGLLAIDLYEMDSNNDMTLIGSSELTSYQVGQINLRNFAAGVQLKANTTYSFICRNNGWNTFYLATSSDTYKAGNAFICETKSNDPSAVNYNAKTELDLYFKVSLK